MCASRAPKAEATEPSQRSEAEQDERDAETFDDTEFYLHLLKEFVEGGGTGGAADDLRSKSKKKQRKLVDRRASKVSG
jgi:hypothetical protein